MMNNNDDKNSAFEARDFLLEIGTEELPADILNELATNLTINFEKALQNAELHYLQTVTYATPRRLTVIVEELVNYQKDRIVEKRGPAIAAAYDEEGSPTAACIGFAKACGVEVSDLQLNKAAAGVFVYFRKKQTGAAVEDLLPGLVNEALKAVLLPKTMRWNENNQSFIRPIRWIVMLYGEKPIQTEIFAIKTGNFTYGHRFHHPDAIPLKNVSDYMPMLLTQGKVIVDFEQRKENIRQQLAKIAKPIGSVIIDEDLLNEVTGLVEWPMALMCNFNSRYLTMPVEALMALIKKQQRCFYLVDKDANLLPNFAVISNIESKNEKRVIQGNERVMEARLSDMEFFYQADLKNSLADYVEKLRDVVYQTGLGSLHDKVLRLVALSNFVAQKIDANILATERTAFLAKADLMTNMVKEIPELQGIMGYYYALHQNEPKIVAQAIKEHYLPRFSGDAMPTSNIALAVGIADRIDTIVGIFSIQQLPTGDKDPYGLRRAALAVIRLISENDLDLDLKELIEKSYSLYTSETKKTLSTQMLDFIFDRLRNWYVDQNVASNVFNAVFVKSNYNLVDFKARIKAVQHLQTVPEAATLIAANKRVTNILKKVTKLPTPEIDMAILTEEAEQRLAKELLDAERLTLPIYKGGFYVETLKILAELKPAIDNFFEKVMVMVEDEKIRTNRINLLFKLKNLLGLVADISLL